MEGDEIEMSEEELQEWIKEEVRKSKLVSPDVLEKCKMLQSYLERREKRAAHLLKLCESVSACEAIVQKQYSLLGWDYTDTHSDDDDKIPNCGPSPQSACGSVQSDTQDKRSSANKLQHNEHLNSNYEKICSIVLKRKPVVVLTRLPRFQISAVQPPTPKKQCSQDQLSSSSLDSEEVWKPNEDSIDSDYSIPSSETDSNNKRNLHDEKNKTSEGGATPKAIFNTESKIDATKARTSQDNSTSDANDSTNASPPTAKTDSNVNNNGSKTLTRGTKRNVNATSTNSSGEDNSSDPDYSISRVRSVSKNKRKFGDGNNKTSKGGATPKANSNAESKSNAAKNRTSQDNSTSDANDGTSPPTAKTNSNINNNGSKTLTHGAKTSDNATSKTTSAACAVGTSTPRLAGGTATKPPPSTPQTEIVVDMFVVARRREMTWQKGQIKEIQIKEDGRVKYKVFFENKGKSLVSGHHIALDCLPKVDNLVVGARVVIERPDDQECCPGILAEVPSRKNRMRFLVFTDDQKPFYVGLRALHLVYKPLPDPLDDIINDDHREFLKEYLARWPYPPLTHYRVGQVVNAELNGTLHKCEVLVVDSSLIQVIFQKTQDKEWIYRGSMRLEHMINMKKALNSTSTKK